MSPVSGPTDPPTRAERLARALRENLLRRKAQARARAAAGAAAVAPSHTRVVRQGPDAEGGGSVAPVPEGIPNGEVSGDAAWAATADGGTHDPDSPGDGAADGESGDGGGGGGGDGGNGG